MTEVYEDIREKLLDAALMHVPFDGWSDQSFRAAMADAGVTAEAARAACPRGAVDLALAFHARGDAAMLARLEQEDLQSLRFRDRVASAVRFRLEAVDDKEAVRRGTTLFSLPIYAADGARAIWGTADKIWTALGDSSDDLNWYTKRATLSSVYGATVLYWLGDDSPGHSGTWEFLDRRIDNVMQVEKLKGQMRGNPVLGRFMKVQDWVFGQVRAPGAHAADDLPGRWRPSGQ